MSPIENKVRQFYELMVERERIRLRKEAGEKWPWTDDPIFRDYRFTNIKREYDKTTRHLKEKYYDKNRERPYEEILMNCATFRFFGTIEFADEIGWQRGFNPEFIIEAARRRKERGLKVFTDAYVITNYGVKGPKENLVVNNILTDLHKNIDDIITVAGKTMRWENTCRELQKVVGFRGTGFMAKEVLLDACMTPLLENCIDKKTWSPCGLGARRGLNRIYGRPPRQSLNETHALREMRHLLGRAPDYLDTNIVDISALTVHDIQWWCCEVSKRWAIEEGGKAKRRYKPMANKEKAWF